MRLSSLRYRPHTGMLPVDESEEYFFALSFSLAGEIARGGGVVAQCACPTSNSSSPLISLSVVGLVIRARGRIVSNCARPTSVACFSHYFSFQSVAVCLLSQGEGMPHSARIGRALLHRARSASTGAPSPWRIFYTGHSSSFHAISQNIHSYRELITNASSILRRSSLPAVFAHRSTFLRIHRWTSANSGEA